MDSVLQELVGLIHKFRPVHPCATLIADFMRRIGYNDEDGILFLLEDYRQEPDYFDARHDGNRGCVNSFYGWGKEWDDPRLHGGRGPRVVVPPQRRSSEDQEDFDWSPLSPIRGGFGFVA